ncbi:hypothetical protein GA0061096_0609 [Fictibacillus enclensis]|uniref:SNIPE associated domain-containing protein n=2 Tax=Fictibacillus enclensis TaxID=1017270 RepID=A0A0V8JC01_9BACL|nr:hypothetical protein AS030_02880 [Fictibacillus enclensis]SCB80690.1 hypothetical protein GA0061096_0609 [Fictibacillus enclensis]
MALASRKEKIEKELESFKPVMDASEIKKELIKKIKELNDQKDTLSKQISDTSSLLDLEKSKVTIGNDIHALETKKSLLNSDMDKLSKEIMFMNDELDTQSFGFYTPKYGFENFEAFQATLKDIRQQQKQMVKEKVATLHRLDWAIGDDKKKGKEFILDTVKLILRAIIIRQ